MLKKIIIILILIVATPFVLNIPKGNFVGAPKRILSKVATIKPAKELYINSIDIIEATNKERVAVGLPPLSTTELLNKSAEIKVDDMIERQYFEHQSPTGEGVSDLGTKVGYHYVVMGENLALGNFSSSEDIVKAWMESPGHRANILNKNYQDIGVSVKHAVYKGQEVWFAVQHFGTNRSVCPKIDSSLKKEIDDINEQLKIEEGIINDLKKILEAPGASKNPGYQENVKIFNENVDHYNNELNISKQNIYLYNNQVKDFNRCIATFQ